jgi:hypothetical protein
VVEPDEEDEPEEPDDPDDPDDGAGLEDGSPRGTAWAQAAAGTNVSVERRQSAERVNLAMGTP